MDEIKRIFDGFIRAILSTIFGLILSIATKEIVSSLTENEILGIFASLAVFAISLYIITSNMKYWGIVYTIGWFIGLVIMYYYMTSLVEWYEIVLYLVISGFILYGKLSKKFL
jgi:hypothetical protein